MFIVLNCGNTKLLVEVSDFASLKAQADAAFAHFLIPGKELDLYYPFQSQGCSIDASVTCDTTFQTFLKVNCTANSIPALFVRQCDPLCLPTDDGDELGVTVEFSSDVEPNNTPAPAANFPVAARKALPGARKALPGAIETQDGAPPKVDRRDSLPEDTPPSGRQRHSTAKELLAGFKPAAPPEPPQIRAVMQDGSCSFLVPFDPYNPPEFFDLQKSIREKFAPKLGLPKDAPGVSFLISVLYPGMNDTHLSFDVDERKDVMHVAKLVQANQSHGETLVTLLVEVVSSQQGGATVWTGNTFVPSPTKEPLEVNQVHTPYKVLKRERERAKELGIPFIPPPSAVSHVEQDPEFKRQALEAEEPPEAEEEID